MSKDSVRIRELEKALGEALLLASREVARSQHTVGSDTARATYNRCYATLYGFVPGPNKSVNKLLALKSEAAHSVPKEDSWL